MLKENQVVKVAWHSQSKNHYIDKGYKFTKYKDSFLVNVEDLSPSATARVKVICDFCGEEYDMAWYHYRETKDKQQKNACYNCRHIKRYKNDLSARQDNLYSKALDACSNKGYILISKKEEIKNNATYVEFLCPVHGSHRIRINNLISGKGCPECAKAERSEKFRLSSNDVEKRILNLGGKLLNKDDYKNRYEKNLIIECPWCGNSFTTSFVLFVQHGGQACPNCKDNESLGEKKVRLFLERNQIVYEQEKWFADCRDINPLPFDFYLPDFNICIEFNGEQHYKEGHFEHSKLDYVKTHDAIKSDYCKNKNIKLITIPYWEFNNVELILNKELIISHEDIV